MMIDDPIIAEWKITKLDPLEPIGGAIVNGEWVDFTEYQKAIIVDGKTIAYLCKFDPPLEIRRVRP